MARFKVEEMTIDFSDGKKVTEAVRKTIKANIAAYTAHQLADKLNDDELKRRERDPSGKSDFFRSYRACAE